MRHERKICKLQPFSRLSKQNPSNTELKENIASGSILPENDDYNHYLDRIALDKTMLRKFSKARICLVQRINLILFNEIRTVLIKLRGNGFRTVLISLKKGIKLDHFHSGFSFIRHFVYKESFLPCQHCNLSNLYSNEANSVYRGPKINFRALQRGIDFSLRSEKEHGKSQIWYRFTSSGRTSPSKALGNTFPPGCV